jgi:hypothetical protein
MCCLAVARVALVKPDKARNVENMILTAAKRGALQSKVRLGCSGQQFGLMCLLKILLMAVPLVVRHGMDACMLVFSELLIAAAAGVPPW